jgi:hypothetical protein
MKIISEDPFFDWGREMNSLIWAAKSGRRFDPGSPDWAVEEVGILLVV